MGYTMVTYKLGQVHMSGCLPVTGNKVVCNTLQPFPNLACQISERHFSKLYAGLLITAMYYRIAGNFRGRNFRKLVKIRFLWRKLSRIAHFCSTKGRHGPNFSAKFERVYSVNKTWENELALLTEYTRSVAKALWLTERD